MAREMVPSRDPREPASLDVTSFYAPIREDLDRLQEQIDRLSASSHPLIAEASAYLLRNSGKRLRPAMLILCSRMAGYRGKDHIVLSALVETIHTASLIHDDIIDNAPLRRGQETSHLRWGPQISVLLGDYLYIRAVSLALNFRDDRIVRLLADASARMIEGVLMEYGLSYGPGITEADYLEIILKKTAFLFSAGCAIGGILGGAPDDRVEALSAFGRGFGMSFQIIDDLLDFTGDEKTLGKPILSDLAEGRITLPLITALSRTDAGKRERISAIIRKRSLTPADRDEILSFVTSDAALDITRRRAADFLNRALPALEPFSDSDYKDSLRGLAAFVLRRTH